MAENSPKLFTGKVALVTGGSSGIGNSTAILYARKGAKVVVSDIHEEPGRQVVRTIEETGSEAIFVKGDVSDAADCEHMVLQAVEKFGRLEEPEEVAELVAWLSSDKAYFVTGAYYAVDGAYLAQ